MISLSHKLLLAAALLLALALADHLARRHRRLGDWLLTAAAAGGVGTLAFFAYAVIRQARFPLQLECMELTVLQHAVRLASGLPVYPLPSPDFVALAYNPGLYVVLTPLIRLWGPSLTLLRLPAIAATCVLIALFGVAAWRGARSARWGLVGAALPVLALRSFDTYLTKGHSDSLMILAALGGVLLLGAGEADGRRIRRRPPAGPVRLAVAALLLAASFWLKQHGALPALGAGLLLLLRERRRGWLPVALLALCGPLAWRLAGPSLFGPDFVTSTLRVPASWSHWDLGGPLRLARFILTWWAAPFAVAAWAWVRAVAERRLMVNAALFVWPFALLSGLLGSLDSGSSDNVFALAGVWTLFVALRTLAAGLRRDAGPWARQLSVGALALTVALLAHDPREWLPPSGAAAAYRDLVGVLRGLDGPLYAPWFGNPPVDVPTTSRAHWVALEDRVRGPGRREGEQPFVKAMLAPVAAAPPPAYLLTISPLEKDRILGWLAGAYVLQDAYGTRFDPVRELPTRFGSRTPRYLYRRADLAAGVRADPGAAAADTLRQSPVGDPLL
ncbi:MAG: hypothetical protein ACYDIE_02975 [Candidatus Krumholzibacteriia bacterium]